MRRRTCRRGAFTWKVKASPFFLCILGEGQRRGGSTVHVRSVSHTLAVVLKSGSKKIREFSGTGKGKKAGGLALEVN